MVHRPGAALWRMAFALFLLVVSLVVFHVPTSEPSLERFAVEICDAPNEHDVPFLSRHAPGSEQGSSSTSWTPCTSLLTPLEREAFLAEITRVRARWFFEPPILRSTSTANPNARGPPVAA
jgi:hypothetical protein